MRSIWNGTLLLGQIPVPIKLHSATESQTISFSEVHLDDGAKVEHRRFCSKEDKEVPYDEVVKGYEVAADQWVVLDKEEIDAAQGERSKLIELEEFVPGGAIDPVFYDKSYYLGVGEDGDKAYRLLHGALERTDRVGLGRFTFHNREYLAAVRPLDGGVLVLHTMRFADELVDAGDLDLPEASRKPSKKEAEMAGRLVEGLQADFEPEQYVDSYREAVLEVIKRKAEGEEIEPAAEDEPDEGADLLSALEASIGNGKGGGKRSGSKSKSRSTSKSKSKSRSKSKAKAKS
jgi:DNA end-binding protein Ku